MSKTKDTGSLREAAERGWQRLAEAIAPYDAEKRGQVLAISRSLGAMDAAEAARDARNILWNFGAIDGADQLREVHGQLKGGYGWAMRELAGLIDPNTVEEQLRKVDVRRHPPEPVKPARTRRRRRL